MMFKSEIENLKNRIIVEYLILDDLLNKTGIALPNLDHLEPNHRLLYRCVDVYKEIKPKWLKLAFANPQKKELLPLYIYAYYLKFKIDMLIRSSNDLYHISKDLIDEKDLKNYELERLLFRLINTNDFKEVELKYNSRRKNEILNIDKNSFINAMSTLLNEDSKTIISYYKKKHSENPNIEYFNNELTPTKYYELLYSFFLVSKQLLHTLSNESIKEILAEIIYESNCHYSFRNSVTIDPIAKIKEQLSYAIKTNKKLG